MDFSTLNKVEAPEAEKIIGEETKETFKKLRFVNLPKTALEKHLEESPETATLVTSSIEQNTSDNDKAISKEASKGGSFGSTTKKAQPAITPKVPDNQTQEMFPITVVEVRENDPLLAKIEPLEQVRILGEINKLKFAVNSVLEKGDYYGKLPTRSGVHKLQTIFNLSTEIREEKYWKDEQGHWVAKYIIRAITPDGRYTEAMGLCEQFEKGRDRTMMDTLATAQTRGTSRAILDLVGFGQVSAEEIDDSKKGKGGFG